MQAKTGQDLPKEGPDSALDEVLGSYKSELGLSDKEGEQLEHLQVSPDSCQFLGKWYATHVLVLFLPKSGQVSDRQQQQQQQHLHYMLAEEAVINTAVCVANACITSPQQICMII